MTEEDLEPILRLIREDLTLIANVQQLRIQWEQTNQKVGKDLSAELASFLASLVKDY